MNLQLDFSPADFIPVLEDLKNGESLTVFPTVRDDQVLKMTPKDPVKRNAIIDNIVLLQKGIHGALVCKAIDLFTERTPSLQDMYPQVLYISGTKTDILAIYERKSDINLVHTIEYEDIFCLDDILVKCIKDVSTWIDKMWSLAKFSHNNLTSDVIMVDSQYNFSIQDFDDAYLELKNVTLAPTVLDYTSPNNPRQISNEVTHFSYVLDGNPDAFINTFRKSINVDIYVLVFSILSQERISRVFNDLPKFRVLVNSMFHPYNMYYIRHDILNGYLPTDRLGIIKYLIEGKVILCCNVHKIIGQ